MLNEVQLGKILGLSLPSLKITDIHWKVQDSQQDSLLFYKLTKDASADKNFRERIQDTHFGWLIVNRDHESRPINSSIIDEKLWPEIQKKILDNLYPLPKLKLFALTGTNGKTTTADLVLQLGELLGKKGLSIGTLGVRENHKSLLDFGLTSPPFMDLRKYIHRFGQNKDFCVLEASSHALIQERLHGLTFDMAGWLSFSQDHLDYHKTMEEYFAAKSLLLNYLSTEAKLFVPDNETSLYEKLKNVSTVIAKAKPITEPLPLFLSTRFNKNNLEVALAIVTEAFRTKFQGPFEKLIAPDGRFFIKSFRSSYIVVDFAHTPDALDNICRGIRESFPTHKLKVLFGCGGDRDRTKRPLMGKIAETWGSKIYLTSDNPRFENPIQIIQDIRAGMTSSHINEIVDRPKAVQIAFSELGENEILLLAGKGHEDYILKDGVKHHYSDIEEVEKFLARKQK